MTVVRCSRHVRKTNILSNSYGCSQTPNRCWYRTKPNQDDSKEVIVVEFQVLLRETKVLEGIYPCCGAPYRCCRRIYPNQDDSEEVILAEFQVIFEGEGVRHPHPLLSEKSH